VGVVGLSLAATRGQATAACPSTCTQQLAECKRTCPGDGQGRRDCRAACAERSTCTAPGARIRTLAYVVTACREDPQSLVSSTQKLVIRRGNCDPVTVMEVATPTPVPDPFPPGSCRVLGRGRRGDGSVATGVFQRMAVLPDGSGVVFEVTKQLSLLPAVTPEPPAEGIFFVRADGTGLHRLGPASRFPTLLAVRDPNSPIGVSFISPGANQFVVSPDGREMAFIDFGPDTDGHEAPQIFLLDLRSPYTRTQLTHQSRVVSGLDPGLCCIDFPNNRTIVFRRAADFRAFQIETDGKSPEKETPPPTVVPGATILSQFDVTGARANIVTVHFPDRPAVGPVPGEGGVTEVFRIDGDNVLQLTDFGRSDTGAGGSAGHIYRGRVIFLASANPTGENPAEICQLFSVDKQASHPPRQLTHLPSDGRPAAGCRGSTFESACDLVYVFLDRITGTVLFSSSCDPVGGNPFGNQLFAMRPDGTGLRQLTNARGMTTDPDGTVHVELPGPVVYSISQSAN
jgi:hypothetical protein